MIESFCCGSFFTNCYVISNENKEAIVIDPGMSFSKVYDYIKSKYEVKAILLTHAHCDHIDGIGYFKDTPIYISKLDETLLYDLNLSLYNAFGLRRNFNLSNLSIKTINDLEILNLIGFNVRCILTPGHTGGSMVFEIENVLFSGDTLFNMSIGRTDFPTGSIEEMTKSLKRILTLYPNDIKIYPGHNDKTTLSFERKYNSYLVNLQKSKH